MTSLTNLALLSLCALSIYGSGAALMHAGRVRAWSISAQIAYSFAFGTGALVMALFALGLLGALTPLAAWLLLALGLLLLPLSIPLTRAAYAALRARVNQLRAAHWGWWMLAGLFGLQAGLHIIGDLAPPQEGDTVTQYLLTARYWTLTGRYWQPDHIWASPLPGHLMMLAAWAMLLRGPSPDTLLYGFSLSTLITGFLMSLCVALAVYSLARVRYSARVGFGAAVLVFLMPDAAYLAQSGKVDLGWAFFETLALAALLRWTLGSSISGLDESSAGGLEGAQDDAALEKRLAPAPWLIIAALMTGLALGSKSQAVLSLPFLAAWILIVSLRRPVQRRLSAAIRALAIFGGIALLCGIPYLAYNAITHRNPFYPVLADVFVRLFDATPSFRSELGTEVFYEWTISGYLRHLWDASLGHPPGFYLGFWAGPAYLMLLPLGLILRRPRSSRRDPVARGMLLYAFAFSIAWFLVKQAVRHFLPGLVLLAVVAAIMLERIDHQARWLRNTVYAALCLSLLVGWGFFAGLNSTNATPLAALGVLSPEAYIARWADEVVQNPIFPDSELLAYANTHLPRDARMVNFNANLALYFPQDQLSVTLREPENLWYSGEEATLLATFDRYSADYLVIWKYTPGALEDQPLILRPSFYQTHGELVFESPRANLYRIYRRRTAGVRER